MHSLSGFVLLWMFGAWAFDGDTEAASILSGITPKGASPLTIFASYFTTVGLALIGILGAWAAFLGIFRLRQNGNFFGARDSNEAFFYPIRMVLGLALCAPVIPAGDNGPAIYLTPGHALIVGIAKTGSKWGDEGQKYSFQTMHAYNLFNDPDYAVKPDIQRAQAMLSGMFEQAGLAARELVHQNPLHQLHGGALTGANYTPFAERWADALLQAKWHQERPNSGFSPSGDALLPLTKQTVASSTLSIPLIPPAGFATQDGDNGLTNSDHVDKTVTREELTESWLCNIFGVTAVVCSDEYNTVRLNNANSIREAIATKQREAWKKMMVMAVYSHIALRDGEITEEQQEQAKKIFTQQIQATAEEFSLETSKLVQNTIANEQLQSSAKFYEEIKNWGWMMGGTFALRAAQDFNRAGSYVDQAYLQFAPKSDLDTLTGSDYVSKMAQGLVNQSADAAGEADADSSNWLVDLISPTSFWSNNPGNANLGTVTNWGRSLAGAGLMMAGAGKSAELIGKHVVVKKMGFGAVLLGAVLLFFGFLLGYVLPTVYAVFGVLGAISWITFVASAFFGVNLWAAAQAAPKGEEHSSQMAAKGWNVMVFIGLYPVLAVAGLAAAIVVTNIGIPLASMMTVGLWGMFDNGVAGGLNGLGNNMFDGLVSIILGGALIVIVYGFLVWSICMTAAQLITQFPRTVLNMVSFSEPGLNPYEQVGQNVMGSITGAAKSVTTVMSPHSPIGRTFNLMKERYNGYTPKKSEGQ